MKTFKYWILESVSSNHVSLINKIVLQYLSKKIGTKFYAYPGIEKFINSTSKGYGVRYFYKNKSIRFNWRSIDITSMTLDSVDLWNGTSRDPNWHVKFDEQVSLVKILPMIVDLIKTPIKSENEFFFIPDQNTSTFNENFILEGVSDDPFDVVLDYLKPNKTIPVSDIYKKHGGPPYKIINQIRTLYPKFFEKEGKSVIFVGTRNDVTKIKNDKESIMGSVGGVRVKINKGGKKEKYIKTKAEDEVSTSETGVSKVAYEEQLEHLKILLKLVAGGKSNALFVAGRGGTGKTQTIESELKSLGLSDGRGYYKNTGSTSPIGIYTTLYDNKDGLILFDDCDTALEDQEGRNLIKAATDTKKMRKIVWSKKSSIIIAKDKYEEMADESDERPENSNGQYLYPNSFEFTGQVVFISNLKLDKLDPDGALRTRGFIIDINPTDVELIDYMSKIAPKITLENGAKLKQNEIDEVIGLIKKSKNKNDISLRKLVRGLNVKAALGNNPMVETIISLYA